MTKRAMYVAGALLFAALLLTLVTVTYSAGRDRSLPTSDCDDTVGCPAKRQAESAAEAVFAGWIYEAVDVPKNFTIYNVRWMAVDDAGRPHLAYGGDVLRYATRDGQAWNRQVVDDSVLVGSGAALALDGDGKPHIAYLDTNLELVKYAHWTGDRWSIEIVDDTYGWAHFQGIAIAVDSQDRPAIAYLKGQDDLYLAWPVQGGWATQEVAAGYGNWWPSLAFDMADRPLISYSDRSVGQIKLSSWTGSAWDHQTVFTVNDEYYDDIYASSVVVDQSGEARIAFIHEEGDDTNDETYVAYAQRVGGSWQVEQIGATNAYIGTALQVDSAGMPHIVTSDLYAVFDGDSWTVEPLDGGSFPSLDLAPGDQPCITYLSGGISFALRDNGAWQSEIVDSSDATGLSSRSIDLAVTSDNLVRASYFNNDNQLVHATETAADWQIDQVAESQWRGMASLALDGLESPWIAYPGYHNGSTVDLARWTGATWLTETVDHASSDEPIILQLDSQDRPHVAYGSDRYAAWNGTAWDKRSPIEGNASETWMAIDGQDRAHFVYRRYNAGNYDLQHSTWLSDSWDTETIQAQTNALSIKVAVDTSDGLHMIYQDNSSGDLIYSVKVDGTWMSETIATIYSWLNTDLVLDRSGNPTVLYYYQGSLYAYMHLARRTPDGWNVEAVGKAKVFRAALALDAHDQPVVMYYPIPNGGIYLARKPELDHKLFLPSIGR